MPQDNLQIVIHIDKNLCKGCGLCVAFCGRGALKMSDKPSKGTRVPEVDIEKCSGCRLCEWYCPDFAIYVERKKKVPAKAV